MFKADSHIHTTFSPDGRQTPEQLIQTAIAAGLTEITVTEHCECNDNAALPPEETPWPDLDVKAYTETYEKLKETSPIKINIGIEIGQATQGREYAEKMLSSYEWDFVLGSLHNVRNEYDFYYMDYAGKDLKKLFSEYFDQLYETVETCRFSSLSHLYYPVRYIYRQGLTLDLEQFDGQIKLILELLAKKGLGLEINTSSVSDSYGDLVPGFRYAKMFRELGGEIVTVGSDGHYAEKVGVGIDVAYKMLKEAGFTAVATFEKQVPVFHNI
ncbi:MAG: histidinol-phosphatase HisJ family protein [Ruminococcaceae bacterium]|nr:histidinol-phosphatase HisJ family protein [Oscillospiraceae bacterium]